MSGLLEKPHLIHIGFPKCASTYLQDWFDKNPQIAYRPGGLAGMHSVFHLLEAVLHQSDDIRLRVTSAESLSQPLDPAMFGSANFDDYSDIACAVQRACDGLYAMFPDAHILIITRGFEDFLRSSYSQLVRHGTTATAADMEAAYSNLDAARSSLAYDTVVELYQNRFGSKVTVLPYELLRNNPRAFHQAIEESYGLDPFDMASSAINASLEPDELYWYPRIARMLHLMPVGRIRVRLLALHARMINNGRWRPWLTLMRWFLGKKDGTLTVPASVVESLAPSARLLVKRARYQTFAAAYGAPKSGH